ncbi:TonB-dependent receptor [Pseudolysobacter antarcticus]|uniref:TonB-dependent receptor n=1 Tax=Pseudolysobacter antarcticus TaxID=2511995 RepID=A0A411HHX0_9GAMM|nr:TonB-dependent receptor [Pseudolysobacter antarcticus]QBB70116.1 TonB-dependent receptor [Pseudolysobacter antarcticus]
MLTHTLSQSIRQALRSGRHYGALLAVPALLTGLPVSVLAQDAGNASTSQKLETIEVTGSRIRRVDVETASPVLTVDRAAIEKSGKLTVGDLVQELPSISGNAATPAMNNGGGTGGSFVSLRGLGTNRTLILVNGHRVVNADINVIPSNLVERIEVLTDGASAVYGSDAIGGVVNFIMRSNYQGAELTTSYGISDKDDGERKAFNLTFGQTSDKGSIVGGIDYNKFDGILSGNRDYGKFALTLGKKQQADGGFPVTKGGSVASPSGFISAPQFSGCDSAGGTFDKSAAAAGGIPAHFRCFQSGTSTSEGDTYNYQAINLIFTPQERTNAYVLGNYKLSDSVEAYMSVFHNKTTSEAQLAPLPLDLFSAQITLDAGQPYNPFGTRLGYLGDDGQKSDGSQDLAIRLSALGPRITHFTQVTDQVITGFKGSLADTSWQWDANLNYGHQSVLNTFFGSLASGDLANSGSFSASCIPNSTAKGGCINIFDQNDPNTAKILKQYSAAPFTNTLNTFRQAEFNINGNLFDLPAGTVSLAAGGSYRKVYTNINVDYIAKADPATGNCAVQISACGTPFQGGFSVKEVYAEVLVPLLKDMPFIHTLNLDLGDRYSDYNTFGSTSNWKAALEYRPLEDLLLRGTVSKVFRAPNTTELFTGLTDSFDNYSKPVGSSSMFKSKNNSQVQTFFAGASVLGKPLLPEIGKSFDFGVVYDPHWLDGLSVSADLWRVYLANNITRPTGQSIVNFCAANLTSPFCGNITFAGGQISQINTVIQNFGRLDTRGVDFGMKYRLPETAFGKFSVSLDTTYTAQYDNQLTVKNADGTSTTVADHAAGTFDAQFGNIARWRGLGSLNWSYGSFSAGWTARYIGGEKVPLIGHVGAWTQNNVTFGYNIAPLNTRIDVGIDNIADKQPTLYYTNNVTNANVDVNTYDTIGRYYFARVSVKF